MHVPHPLPSGLHTDFPGVGQDPMLAPCAPAGAFEGATAADDTTAVGVVAGARGAEVATAEDAGAEVATAEDAGAEVVAEDAASFACSGPPDPGSCPPQVPTGATNGSDPIRCTVLPRFACGIANTSPLAGLVQPLPLLARNMSGKESNPSAARCSGIRWRRS